MSDGFIGVGTYRDNDVAVKLVDGASGTAATNKLSIVKEGDTFVAGTNDFGVPVFGVDADGKAKLIESTPDGIKVDAAPLSHAGTTPDSVQIGNGTDTLEISADGEASVAISKAQAAIGASAPTQAIQIAGQDASGNLQTISLDSNGRQEVVIRDAGAPVLAYSAFGGNGIANGVTENFDYVVTDTKNFTGKNVCIAADGKILVEVGTFDGTTFTVKKAWFQQPAISNDFDISGITLLGDATNAIRVAITAKQGFSSDVRASIQGIEV